MTLNDALRDAFGAELRRSDPVSGGDINDAFALTLTDGARVFMKSNRAASPAFFQAEAAGLAAICDTGCIQHSFRSDDRRKGGIFITVIYDRI